MKSKLSNLEIAQKNAENAAKETNDKIAELGNHTGALFTSLERIQSLLEQIRNVPLENRIKYEKIKEIGVNWKRQVEKIEMEYKKAEIKAASKGIAGIGTGVAVAAMGPTVAMGIATTFGVASTGTAISTLSGAAAVNAALAWLGGGALAAGGGGMAAGSAFLALAGPTGWAIAGVAILSSGLMFFKNKSDKERLDNIYTLISKRDISSWKLAILELNERINRIDKEGIELEEAIIRIKGFGIDYSKMSQEQQYELGAYVNLMEASTMLLVDPILGIQPKYSEKNLEKLCLSENSINRRYYEDNRKMVIAMANLLYKIELDDKEKKLLVKSLRKNKEFLSSIEKSKKDFGVYDITMIERALNNLTD